MGLIKPDPKTLIGNYNPKIDLQKCYNPNIKFYYGMEAAPKKITSKFWE